MKPIIIVVLLHRSNTFYHGHNSEAINNKDKKQKQKLFGTQLFLKSVQKNLLQCTTVNACHTMEAVTMTLIKLMNVKDLWDKIGKREISLYDYMEGMSLVYKNKQSELETRFGSLDSKNDNV